MKTRNMLGKLVILYFYMYFIGPLIWGGWMIYRLRIISLQEYYHCLLSPVTIIMFFSYFLLNLFWIKRLLNETSTFSSALKVHCFSLLSFETIGTSIFMSLLATNDFSYIALNLSDWRVKAIIGSLSGASLVFLFYILFSAVIFTNIADNDKSAEPYMVRKSLLTLKAFNLAMYILGLILFIGSAAAAFILRYQNVSAAYNSGDAAMFGVTMAFPIFMSALLYLKSVKKIDAFNKPLKDISKSKRLKDKKATILNLNSAVQWFFLFVFFILLLTGKLKAWLFILITGFFTSLLIGRVYCGWCCPVNTMNGFVDRLYKLLRIKKRTIPKFMRHRFFIIICFTLLVGLLIFSLLNGKRLPLFTMITFSGVLVSSIFVSSFWCSHLCPWGAIFKIISKYSLFKWALDPDSCINCGICASSCPSSSIQMSDNTVQSIEFSRCLQCLQCTSKCPQNAINLKMKKRQSSCTPAEVPIHVN